MLIIQLPECGLDEQWKKKIKKEKNKLQQQRLQFNFNVLIVFYPHNWDVCNQASDCCCLGLSFLLYLHVSHWSRPSVNSFLPFRGLSQGNAPLLPPEFPHTNAGRSLNGLGRVSVGAAQAAPWAHQGRRSQPAGSAGLGLAPAHTSVHTQGACVVFTHTWDSQVRYNIQTAVFLRFMVYTGNFCLKLFW